MLAGREKRKHAELETRLMAVELLALLKRRFTYCELEKLTGFSNGMLSRYVTGQ
ncbi:MAG TPA: phosphoribosyltransferase, partial [Pyrodictium sp.]|nr:phosphoribosyltransferase [Pyrodictium sp.]